MVTQKKLITTLTFYFLLFACGGASSLFAQAPGLYINEVSQGPSGAKEWVELIVVGTPTCSTIPTMDLRGWYIDDNNGNHATGAGTGIASGCVRLSNDPLWSAVPIGTLILIYNDADRDPALPATDDLSLNDGNCRLVIPISNCTLFQQSTTQPSTATAVYPSSGLSPCGLWTDISMNNTDDSFQTIDPSGNLFHSVSWGNNTLNDIIYFAGPSTAMVAKMMNTNNNNISTQSNWAFTTIASETPGVANDAANQSWICRMNNGCTPLTSIALSTSQTNATCTCNGSATVTASGGFTGCGDPYTYSWSSGGTAASISSLCAGSYTVTVSDVNGCSQTASVTIIQPAPLSATTSQTNLTCNGSGNGSATVSASGGTPGYTYSWSPNGGTNATANNLAAGNYTCTITDASGCTTTQTFLITQPTPISATASQNNLTCNGSGNGSATVSASGGTPGYTYSWNPTGQTTATANNLAAGNYTCTITDASGCTTTQTFLITQPAVLSASSSSTPATCSGNNGSASVSASGGSPNYTYSWSSGGTNATENNLASGSYTCTITDANNCSLSETVTVTNSGGPTANIASSLNTSCSGGNNGSATVNVTGGTSPYTYSWSPAGGTNATANNLTAGNYTCTVTDANGCVNTISVSITEPAVLSASVTTINILCNGGNTGSITLTVTGGTANYTYSWTPGAQTTQNISNVTAGSYTCTITDANGCTTTASATITEPPPLSSSVSETDASCNSSNGTASVSVSGGNPAYTYSWSSGGTSATENNLAAGTYTCTITDANGCTASATVTVNTTGAPPVASLSAGGPTSICTGDSVQLTASGGTTFLWNTGATTASIYANAAGNYSVIVSNSCGSDTATITITVLPLPVATLSGNISICQGQQTTLTASGGTTYLWSNGATTSSITVTTGGTYFVIASNSCGSDTAQVVVTSSTVIASFNANPDSGNVPLVVNFSDNSVNANSWSWNFGDGNNASSSGPTNTFQAPGTYTVTLIVTNAQGCSDTATGIIVVSDVPVVIEVPNVFTPNGDGTNDEFVITTIGVKTLRLKIYDRWGVLMTDIQSVNQGWDGRSTSGLQATDGTYYYVLDATGYDGKNYNMHGFLTLLK